MSCPQRSGGESLGRGGEELNVAPTHAIGAALFILLAMGIIFCSLVGLVKTLRALAAAEAPAATAPTTTSRFMFFVPFPELMDSPQTIKT